MATASTVARCAGLISASFYLVLKDLEIFLSYKSHVNMPYIHGMNYCETSEKLIENGKVQRQLLLVIHYLTHQKSTDENMRDCKNPQLGGVR